MIKLVKIILFNLFDDDMIIITDIKCIIELNDHKPKKFIRTNKNSFYIKEDKTN